MFEGFTKLAPELVAQRQPGVRLPQLRTRRDFFTELHGPPEELRRRVGATSVVVQLTESQERRHHRGPILEALANREGFLETVFCNVGCHPGPDR